MILHILKKVCLKKVSVWLLFIVSSYPVKQGARELGAKRHVVRLPVVQVKKILSYGEEIVLAFLNECVNSVKDRCERGGEPL